MNMDKNTITGIVLLAALFILFFWYTNKQQAAIQGAKQRIAHSTAKAHAAKITPAQREAAKIDSLKNDTLNRISEAGIFQGGATGTEQLTVVENELLRATFSNKGGSLKSVELKKY